MTGVQTCALPISIALADAKKEVTDEDLAALVEQQRIEGPAEDAAARIALGEWSVSSASGGRSSGKVTVRLAGEARTADGSGNGPVDALFGAVDAAIASAIDWHPVLVDYEIRAVTAGEDAQGRVLVRLRRSNDPDAEHGMATGHGLSTNIIEASLEAYVGALEKLLGADSGIESGAARRRAQ